jgi:hypothetical protein
MYQAVASMSFSLDAMFEFAQLMYLIYVLFVLFAKTAIITVQYSSQGPTIDCLYSNFQGRV